MHEHVEILPKDMLKMSLEAKTNTMGHSLIKKIKIFLHEHKFFPTLSKITQP